MSAPTYAHVLNGLVPWQSVHRGALAQRTARVVGGKPLWMFHGCSKTRCRVACHKPWWNINDAVQLTGYLQLAAVVQHPALMTALTLSQHQEILFLACRRNIFILKIQNAGIEFSIPHVVFSASMTNLQIRSFSQQAMGGSCIILMSPSFQSTVVACSELGDDSAIYNLVFGE